MQEITGNIVAAENARPMNTEDICVWLFGVSKDELFADIRRGNSHDDIIISQTPEKEAG